MIKLLLNGRFGNQMFQYAFAVAMTKKFKTCLEIDASRTGNEVDHFFNTSEFEKKHLPKRIDKWIYHKRKRFGKIPIITEDVTKPLQELYNNAVYDGYFQNEMYFKYDLETIRGIFVFKQVFLEEFETISHQYDFQNSIVVHARLTDYLTWEIGGLGGPDLSLPKQYYINAIKKFTNDFKAPVILVSDDVILAKERLDFLENVTIINYTPQIRFQALMQAKQLVISNSTFAWWAAYLNPNNPVVMAPKHWLGFKVKRDYPYGIMPKAFTAVDF